MHAVGRRRTENEMEALIASAAKLFADIVKPKRITINVPANVK
jgi:hypothetical protein